eukprot:CAMPEP_0197627160 /NCGR_PEP_ID=MMETSP1338-20131121/5846_1 /TAXON_ID=43686 ORGANISM="Pelagodinium beii, Strain RCC1491" /NCGR_SAMPLE_ID=MMETSP1338 /ASSEMBLY_ACC=CAM_ASM_000754 /LENGTH=172 /DNA_ID=CAMNT_0043197801 /DNA_START=80 /DNA_END=594 /DNA_ORIENTATION=-
MGHFPSSRAKSKENFIQDVEYRVLALADSTRPSPQPAKLRDWGLYLGGLTEATDLSLLERLRINAVVNAASSVCIHTPRGGVPSEELRVLKLDADDQPDYPLLRNHFAQFQDFISEAKREGCQVLVHCQAGLNRSAALCAAYLIRVERLTLLGAVDLLLARRGYVLTNQGFV